MAKKKKKGTEKKFSHSDYPIKTLFQLSFLAGTIAFLYSFYTGELLMAVVRGFSFFLIFAIFGGLILVTVVSILASLREQQTEAMREKIEAEQREFIEAQMRLQEEIERLASEFDEDANLPDIPDLDSES